MSYDFQSGGDASASSGLLDINESGSKSKDQHPQEYPITPEQEELVKAVESTYKKHKKYRKKYDHDWLENYKMFRGDQWKHKRPSYRQSEVVNMIFQAIQSTVPMQTDARPKFEFLPPEPKDFRLAEILNMLSTADWERNDWLYILLELLYDAHFYSCSWGYVGWDEDANDGIGEIVFETEDPFFMFPDPNARDVNCRRSKTLIKAEPVDVDVLKKRYPKFARYLKSDVTDFQDLNRDVKREDFSSEYSSLDVDVLENDKSTGDNSAEKALEITCWKMDDSVVEEKVMEKVLSESIDPMTGQPTEVEQEVESIQKKLKYPNGRKTIVVNKIPVYDGPSEFDDRSFPYFKHVNYILPREFYGISEVEQLKGPQRIFNTLISYALDVLVLMGNPIWIVDTNSQVDTDELYNKPGMIVEKAPGSQVSREAGVNLQPYVLQLVDKIKLMFDDVAGTQDVSRGAADGVTAARAIEALQEAANTRVRQKSRILDKALNNWGKLWCSRVFQYRTSPYVYRMTGLDGGEQYFKFHIDGENAVFQQVSMSEGGQQVQQDPETVPLTKTFDIRITTGSSLSIAKRDTFNKAVQLFDRKALSQESLLEAAEWKNIPKEMERLAQESQAKMQAEMQAMAASGKTPLQQGSPVI